MADLDRNLRLTGKRMVKQKAYWQSKMADEIRPSLIIPGPAIKVPGRPESRQEQVEIPVSPQIADRLLKMSRGSDITLYAVLVAGLKALIHRYSGSDDSIVLSPVFKPGVSPDTFNRLVVVRDRIVPSMTFKELLVNVGRSLQEAYENQDYPLEDVPELKSFYLGQNKGWSICDTACMLENIHDGATLALLSAQAVFGFCLAGSEVQGKIVFDAALYERFYIERLAGHFVHLLGQALADVQVTVCGLSVLSEQERAELLGSLGVGEKESIPGATVVDLFLNQVARTPDRTALRGLTLSDKTVGANNYSPHHYSLSYSELDRRASELAGELRAQGIGQGSVVAILTGRKVEMIVGLLGILKAGAAYLPIDPAYPEERVQYMLADSGAEIVLDRRFFEMDASAVRQAHRIAPLSNRLDLEPVPERSREQMNVPSKLMHAPFGRMRNCCPLPYIEGGNLAYVIYTSGSTGRPKGVMIQHQAVVNFISGIRRIIPFGENDVLLSLTTVSFDIFGLEIYLPLTVGARLVLGSEAEQLDGSLAVRRLEEEQVTILQVTPSRLFSFLANPDGLRALKRLAYLLVGGEAFDRALLDEVRPVVGGRIFNMYGPTETTIWSTVKELTGHVQLTIGRPIINTGIYILNRENDLQPIGLPGELCIGGAGLARGYLNNPELTAERFVGADIPIGAGLTQGVGANNYSPLRDSGVMRLYKTGDLARWLDDGDIEFLGRLDAQVKIRGFRIELGEIEAKLRKHPAIEEAVVISRETGTVEKYLCAYLRLKQVEPGQGVGPVELREFLSHTLPDYMIPAYFVFLAQFPLTPNGKLDRKALPAPEVKAGQDYVSPRDEVDSELVAIWSELLSVQAENIGIHDNFFHLGGHSLKATELIYRIHQELDVRVPLPIVFGLPTVRGLADYIREEAREDRYTGLEAVEKKTYYPVSSAQKRMYLLQQMDLENTVYNISGVMSLEGKLEAERFQDIFRCLIDRHESLRTSFFLVDDEPVQLVLERVSFELEVFRTDGRGGRGGQELIEHIIKEFIRPFDLATAPLIRVGLIKNGEEEHILMVDMHHIISDWTSLAILTREFMLLYSGETPAPLRIQYKDYAAWQIKERQIQGYKDQEKYWHEVFFGYIPVIDLPYDYPRPAVKSFAGKVNPFELGEVETAYLRGLALKEGLTLFMVLLGVYGVILSKLSDQEDIVVGTPVSGRGRVDVQGILGMFVNTLAIRSNPSGDKKFCDYLAEIKEKTLSGIENRDFPFEELVDHVVKGRDVSRNPLFDVMFVLQNVDMEEIVIPDLKMKSYEREKRTARFDLTLVVREGRDRLYCSLEYCTALFSEASINRCIGYFREVIGAVVRDEGKKIGEIELLSEEERERVIDELSRGEAHAYPLDKTISELFVGQVERTPDHAAVQGVLLSDWLDRPVMTLTYRELARKADRLAQELRMKAVGANVIVGIQVERSIEMCIGILGILMVGGAYLPIDPEAPQERVQYMLADSGAEVVLDRWSFEMGASAPLSNRLDLEPVPERSGEQVNAPFGRVPIVDSAFISQSQGAERSDAVSLSNRRGAGSEGDCCEISAPRSTASTDLAYIIYTSGTTGRPKGVAVNHQGAVNTLLCRREEYKLSPAHKVLQLLSYTFDGFVVVFFTPIISGAFVVFLQKEEVQDMVRLKAAIIRRQITHFIGVPALFQAILEGLSADELDSLECATVAGDRVSPGLIALSRQKKPDLELVQEYGVTEASVTSSLHHHQELEERSKIGRPTWNTAIYIMGRHGRLQPIGLAGELLIGGLGLARGYLNNPELTAEKFVGADIPIGAGLTQQSPSLPAKTVLSFACGFTNCGLSAIRFSMPVQGIAAAPRTPATTHHLPITNRLYKTGDLCRWLDDGTIEFLGRIDFQVKIRGFRIELGEIEAQLLKHPEIKEAVVLARDGDNGEKYLCAYLVTKAGQTLETKTLRDFLSRTLPNYMMPPHFIILEQMPLNINGKIDRKALSVMGWDPQTLPYIAPENEFEWRLAEIWAELLHLDRDKISTNWVFFEIGGDSLKAIQMIAQIHQRFGVQFSLLEVFRASPTIKDISSSLQVICLKSSSKTDKGKAIQQEIII